MKIHWESECGHKSSCEIGLNSSGYPDSSLAGLVRRALMDHVLKFRRCKKADITRVESTEERDRRIRDSRKVYAGVF